MKLSSKILITVNFVALLLTSTASINILLRISKDNSTHDNVFTLLVFIGLLFISLTLLKILYNTGLDIIDSGEIEWSKANKLLNKVLLGIAYFYGISTSIISVGFGFNISPENDYFLNIMLLILAVGFIGISYLMFKVAFSFHKKIKSKGDIE